MSERPQILEQLQVEFDRAACRTLAASPRRRVAHRPLSLTLAIVTVLVAAAAAGAALLIGSGSPLQAPHARDLLSNGVPVPASARLAGLDAPDPQAGQPAWDIRLSRTRAGETCTAVGQVVGGRFGIVGLDHVFRALPLGGVDACGIRSTGGPLLAGARVFVGTDEQGTRTVVNGVAGRGTRSVIAYGPEGPRRLKLGRDASFITVYRGYLEDVRPRIVVVSNTGAEHTVSFAQDSLFEVADPQGGAPWTIGAGPDLNLGAYPDEDCVQASRQLDHSNPGIASSSQTPEICGRLGSSPLFVVLRRFVAGSGAHTGYPWGNNPARTIVYGMAAPRVKSLTLSGAGASRGLTIGRREGVFMAVLDGHVDPRALTLTAHLADGSTRTYTRSSNALAYEGNEPLGEPPVPGVREPTPASEPEHAPLELPVRASVRETQPLADPGGAAPWVLRSWRAHPNPELGGGLGRRGDELLCFQVAVLHSGVLREPSFGSAAEPLSATPGAAGEQERCNLAGQLAKRGALYSTEAFVGDPYAYAPKPLRTVVSGQLAPGATHALLLGAGAPRRLAVDPNRAFMAVLPGRYWDAWLHVAFTFHGRRVGAGAPPPSGFPRTPQARAPDPEESAPWGFAVAANGSAWMGNIVAGRLADVDPLTGEVHDGPVESGGDGLLRQTPAREPVAFSVQEIQSPELPRFPRRPLLGALTLPQLERRTLPGRTVVTGVASADVVSVTLATPSDVRTLRPSGPRHVLIVVYDGIFYSGTATATILLRDGRTVSESPRGLRDLGENPPPRTSMRRTLQLLEGERSRLDANPARPSRSLPATVRTIGLVRRRIAYEQAHPGVLPGV